jgi:peptidoglycan/xylan/chitin deacetylase (PgdA/CDA1 family)
MNAFEPLLSAACRLKRGGIILNYHTLDAQQTRRHVEWLARHFDLIHHAELLPRQQRRARRPFCLISFDDGKRSNYTETAPVLERMGVPAVFFVVTEFVTTGEHPLWFDQYEALLRRGGALPPGLDPGALKLLPHDLRAERVRRACERAGVEVDMDDDAVAPMSWDQVRELGRQGHTIGAHSRWHAILTNEPLEAAKADIRASIETVAAETGSPCRTFSFPNGNYTARLGRYALSCGVETVMTTEPLWVARGIQSWRLPRIQIHGDPPFGRQVAKLALASLGRVLENPDGTGRFYVRMQREAARREPDGVEAHASPANDPTHAVRRVDATRR